MAIKINYWQLIGFLTGLAMIVVGIDANQDGKVDGKEKLSAARRSAQALLQTYPSLAGKISPQSLDEAIEHLVAAMNVFIK